MEVLVALSNLAENCRFLKKHSESDCIMARVAFLRTLHHVKPAAPDGASAKVQGPKVWQVFEDGAWRLDGLEDKIGRYEPGRGAHEPLSQWCLRSIDRLAGRVTFLLQEPDAADGKRGCFRAQRCPSQLRVGPP